ncbi:hypothetical protein V8J11_00255 [Streptomyces hygroscopicus subsp. hygroscopicus]|uniref:hypothetical protein n=1 Tax=Streptomyces hygroscopicus TaxID=1912 RepID=UPI000767C690|nr:hypothetical protein [Streptomyces hygroscopicus]
MRTVAVPATSRSRPRPFHSDRKAGREQTTDVDTVEQTRRTLAEAALARVQEGARERVLTNGPDRSPPR